MRADAHSELLSSYPWGRPTPARSRSTSRNGVDRGEHLVFRDQGTPPRPNSESHDWAAAFGTDLSPNATRDGERLPRPAGPGSDLPCVRSERTAAAGAL